MTTPARAAPVAPPRRWAASLRAAAAALLLAALTLAAPGPATAQTAPDPAAQERSAPAATPAPNLPAALLDPATPMDEFTLRLIPLTVTELAALSERWLGIVQAKTVDVIEEGIRLRRAEATPAAAEARSALDALVEARRTLFDRFEAVISAYELKGGDAAKVASYRTYREAIFVEETRATDWRTLLSEAAGWLRAPDGGLRILRDVGIALAALVALLLAARLVRRVVRRWIGHVPNLSRMLQGFVAMAAYWLTLAFGLMMVLAALGVDISPLFALVGGASFILAFALQDTLGNLAAGLMIMLNRPFDEGDFVDIGGVQGQVRQVSLVSTTVATPDNQIVVVPNAKVWGEVIMNATASPTRRVDLAFAVPHDASIPQVQATLEETVRAHPLVLAEPEPIVRVNALSETTVTFVVWPWTAGGDYWTVYWDLTRQVKENLQRAGVMGAALPTDPPPDAAPTPA